MCLTSAWKKHQVVFLFKYLCCSFLFSRKFTCNSISISAVPRHMPRFLEWQTPLGQQGVELKLTTWPWKHKTLVLLTHFNNFVMLAKLASYLNATLLLQNIANYWALLILTNVWPGLLANIVLSVILYGQNIIYEDTSKL